MSGQSPQMHDQLLKIQQARQNLEAVMYQKQQLAAEQAETERALEELRSGGEGDAYRQAGQILVKAERPKIISDLEELQELAKTKASVLEKQEARIRESLAEYEAKAREMASK